MSHFNHLQRSPNTDRSEAIEQVGPFAGGGTTCVLATFVLLEWGSQSFHPLES